MEKEKKLLDFDAHAFQRAQTALENMGKNAQILIRAWESQPVLKKTPITTEILHAIIVGGPGYIRNKITEMIKESYDKRPPGLSAQIPIDEISLLDVDEDKLNRFCDSLKSGPSEVNVEHVSYSMLSIENGKIHVKPETIEYLKDKFCIYSSDERLSEINELGQLTAACMNNLMAIIKKEREQKEAARGFKFQNPVSLFTKANPNVMNPKPGALYEEGDKYVFNLKYFK